MGRCFSPLRSAVLVASLTALAGTASGQLLSRTFEGDTVGSYPSGWQVQFPGNSQTVGTTAFFSGKSLRMVAAPFGAAESFIPFTPPSGTWTFSYSIRMDSASTNANDGGIVVYYRRPLGEVGGGIARQGGGTNPYTINLGNLWTGIPAVADRWYEVTAVVRSADGEADYYLDGILVAPGRPLGAPAGSSRIMANTGAIDNGQLIGYIDNLRVLEGDQRGLLAHWKFDGDALDSSGNGYHATIVNGAGFTAGRIDGSIFLNGTGQYLYADHAGRLTFDLDTQSHSFAALVLVNPTETGRWTLIQDRWGCNCAVSYNLIGRFDTSPSRLAANSYYGEASGIGFEAVRTPDVTRGVWQHVAVTFDAATGVKTLYVNGNPAGVSTRPGAPFTGTGNTRLTIGGQWDSTGAVSSLMDGRIDDLRIYGRPLSQAEVQGLIPVKCTDADIAQTDGTPGPDGRVDNGDFSLFFTTFFAGCP